MQTTASPRRHDLDWIRIAAFGLLIVYHVGMYYVSWDWHVKSPFAAKTIEPLMMLSSPWRLALLFLVSGAATAFLLGRTPQGFVGSRSRRLLIPLAFGMLVMVVPQAYYEVVEKHAYAEGWLAFYARYLAGYGGFCGPKQCLILPTWNHLWFVAYLWVYSVLLWAALKWLPGPLAALEARVAQSCSGLGVLLWPAALLAVIRVALAGPFPSTHAMVGDWYNHALFGSVFLLGFLIARQAPVWEALHRHRWLGLGLAAASYACLVWYLGSHSPAHPPSDALRAAMRIVHGLNQWAAIVAVLGFARLLAPGSGPARRYLTQAVFPFYIVHQTATVVMAHHLKPLALVPVVEGPLLIAATFAVCFASFEVIRRVGWMRPLFGLPRERRAATEDSALQPA